MTINSNRASRQQKSRRASSFEKTSARVEKTQINIFSILLKIAAPLAFCASFGLALFYAYDTTSAYGIPATVVMLSIVAAFEMAKPGVVEGIFYNFKSRSYFAAFVCLLIATLAIVYSLTAGFSLMGKWRGDAVAGRGHEAASYAALERERGELETALARPYRLSVIVQADIDAHNGVSLETWNATRARDGAGKRAGPGCVDVTVKASQTACQPVIALRGELGASAALEARAARLREVRAALANGKPPGRADYGAATWATIISTLTFGAVRLQEASIGEAVPFIAEILLELIAAFSIMIYKMGDKKPELTAIECSNSPGELKLDQKPIVAALVDPTVTIAGASVPAAGSIRGALGLSNSIKTGVSRIRPAQEGAHSWARGSVRRSGGSRVTAEEAHESCVRYCIAHGFIEPDINNTARAITPYLDKYGAVRKKKNGCSVYDGLTIADLSIN